MSGAQQQSTDLVVIGGGAIGLAVAWQARQRGLAVTVVERAQPGAGSSGVAAGMLAPVTEAGFGEDELLALNRESARRWPDFAADLSRASGRDPGYRRSGTLLVAADGDAAEALSRELAYRESLCLPVTRLLPGAARALEPALAPTLRAAMHAPEDHAVDPRALVGALVAALRAAGGAVRTGCEVRSLELDGDRVAGVRLAGDELVVAANVVIAAGCWSASLDGLPPEGRLPIRPVKGQVVRLRDPAGPGLLERVLRTAEVYVVPRGDGRYVLGATVEERGFDTTVTAGALHNLLRDAAEVLPGILELELEEASAGLRPGTPDNAPIIGPGAVAGLHWATGHHRNGILLAPITADLVIGALGGEATPELARPFAPARFAAEVAA